jgi:hypothetical protein
VIALRDAAGREAEDAAVPVLAGQDEDPDVVGDFSVATLHLLERGVAHLVLDLLPLDVHPIELAADPPGRVFIDGGEEIDGGVGRGQASRGIDARSDLEADIYSS